MSLSSLRSSYAPARRRRLDTERERFFVCSGYIELTAEQAHTAAKNEGLTLQMSESSATGFKGVVCCQEGERREVVTANVRRGVRLVYLGSFATPQQAALEYARQPEAQAALTKSRSKASAGDSQVFQVPPEPVMLSLRAPQLTAT